MVDFTIGDGVLSGIITNGETILQIPDGVQIIDIEMTSDVDEIRELIISSSVNELNVDNLLRWDNLECISVDPDNESFMSIDGVLFSKDGKELLLYPGKKSNKEYIVPDKVEIIGDEAFKWNDSINRVNLNNVKVVGNSAFELCSNIQFIDFGLVEVIGIWAFSSCEKLKTISLPDSLRWIGREAFSGTKLKSVDIPKSVVAIEELAFEPCERVSLYDCIDTDALEVPWNKGDIRIVYENNTNNRHYELLSYQKSIPDLFINRSSIRKIHDREIVLLSAKTGEVIDVVWIPSDELYCEMISAWSRPAKVNHKRIDELFEKYKKPKNKIETAVRRLLYPVNLSRDMEDKYKKYISRSPGFVKKCIDSGDLKLLSDFEAFSGIKPTNIDEFIDYSVKKKKKEITAYLMNYKNTQIGSSKKKNDLLLEVPDIWTVNKNGELGRYLGDETDVVFPSEVKGKKVVGISNTNTKTPDNYKKIKSVIIPEGYEKIGNYAFYECKNLERVVLPDSLKSIGIQAFRGCTKLKEIIMTDNISEIGIGAFEDCDKLSRVSLSKSLTVLPKDLFWGCPIKKIDIPESIVELGQNVFKYTKLEVMIVRCRKMKAYQSIIQKKPTVYAYYPDAVQEVSGFANVKPIIIKKDEMI